MTINWSHINEAIVTSIITQHMEYTYMKSKAQLTRENERCSDCTVATSDE